MSLEFFRLNKKMIKISSKLTKNRILHFLNSNFYKEQLQSESMMAGRGTQTPKAREISQATQQNQDGKSKQQEGISSDRQSEDTFPQVLPIYDQDGSDDDENINQIDQMFDFILYYETSIKDGNNNLQFESNVRTIIHNFCHFLKTNYDIIFADTVLMCLQDEIEKQQVMFGSDETKQNPLKTFEQDFKRIKPTMTKCRFRMDISFLTLLIHTLAKQGKIASNSEAHRKFKVALDDIFYNLIRRNFQELDVDSKFFIFKHSQKDKALVRELSTPLSSKAGPEPVNFNLQTSENFTADSVHYQIDLLGTKDSYSDSEELEGQRKLPRSEGQDISDPQVIYNSCKRLLFKVNLVINDSKGNKVVDKKLQKISSLFDEYGAEISNTCKDLVEKVKFMEKEKLIAANNQEAILREMGMLYETSTSLDNFDSQRNNDAQVEAQDIQSSVELYFSFYTIPSYVGLLRDQDIEYLCEEAVKENILVNDDDHEDLIRVAKLMDYLGYGTQLNSQRRLNNEEVDLSSLVRQFNKKQLVKSIPYYFKRTQIETQTFRDKDYNVYFYDEIQRKIIYGILRRTYAMMAQNLLEHALLIRPIDSLNVVLAQKYLGSLLFNQRHFFRVTVMNGLGSGQKLKQAMKILKEELKMSQILNCLQVSHNGQEVYLLKSSRFNKNFYQAQDLEEGNLIPFSQFYAPIDQKEQKIDILSSTLNDTTDQTCQELDQSQDKQGELNQRPSNYIVQNMAHSLSEPVNISNQENLVEYELPFWLLFQLQESSENGGEIRMNVTFHLPLYKSHSQLNYQIVEKEIERACKIIAQRIQVIFLLQQTHENRFMPKNFKINCRGDSKIQSPKKQYNASGFQSYQMMTQKQTQNRLESAVKNLHNGQDLPLSPGTVKQMTNGLKQTVQNQAAKKTGSNLANSQSNTQTSNKLPTITSKFKSRMAKINQIGGNTTDDQSDNNQAAKINLNEQTTIQTQEQMDQSFIDSSDNTFASTKKSMLTQIPSQFSNQVPPPPKIYKVNLMFEHVFKIKHQSVSLEAALGQIAIQAKIYHPISEEENLYVTMINSKVYLMRIEGKKLIEPKKAHTNQSLRSFSNPNNTFEFQNLQQNTENHQSANTKVLDSIGVIVQNTNSVFGNANKSKGGAPSFKQSTLNSQMQNCNQIIMELYGAYPVTYQNVEPLILNIDNILKKLTLNVLADNTLVAGSLSRDDLNYLESSDDQMLLLFPIHEGIDDRYAFLRFLKQNLSRYLYQVSIKQEHAQNQTTNFSHSIAESGVRPTNSMISSTQLHKQDSMTQSNILNSGILNLQGSHHPSERSKQIILTTGAAAGSGSFAGNDFFSRLNRQSSVSSGEEGGLLGPHSTVQPINDNDSSSIQITNQRLMNPIMSKSQNIEVLSSGGKDDFIRIDIREDNSASLSDDGESVIDSKSFFGTQQKIQYRYEDFLLLYNYKMPLKKIVKNNTQTNIAERQKANIINIQQIFNEALTLINFGVLRSFQNDFNHSKGSNQNLNSLTTLSMEQLMKDIESEFELMETPHYEQNSGKVTQILGLKYDYKSTFNCKEVEQMAGKTYLPLIFKTTKTDIVQGQRLQLSNSEFGVPLPAGHKQSWLMLKLNVLGELNEERFIQNLILNVNQSFNEALIEHCVRKFFKPMSQVPYFAGFEDRRSMAAAQQPNKQDNMPVQEHNINAKPSGTNDRTTFSKKISQLQNLVSQGKNLMTTIVHEFEKLIYGDPNELYLSLLFSMITHYHQEFRSMYKKTKMQEEYMKDEYGMAIIIELIEKKSSQSQSKEKIVKTVILNLSVELLPQNYNLVYKELKRHLNRTSTVLRNLQPRIKLIIGSIAFKKELFHQEESQQLSKSDSQIIVRIFKDPTLQLDGLRGEPEKIEDNQTAIKGFSDIVANVAVTSRQKLEEESKIVYKRNFFMVLSMYESKVSYQSFNLEKRTFKLNTNMILNQLTWHSNRQDYFKRIVSQKLGTVYTLKDFYSSSHYVRTQGMDIDALHKKYNISVYPYQKIEDAKNEVNDNGLKGYHGLLSADKYTFEEKIKLIEGKQTYQFTNPRLHKSRSKRRRIPRQERKEHVQIKECQNVADEYLKSIEVSQDALRFLYKSISCKTANQEKRLGIDEFSHPHLVSGERDRRKRSQHEMIGMSALAMRQQMLKGGQKISEKKYQEDHIEGKDNEIDKNRQSKKSVVPYKEFIRNKSVLENILKNNIKNEIELTKILTVSPGIGPSRIDFIFCERERIQQKYHQQFNQLSSNQQISRSSFDDRVGSSSNLSDKILLNNPLYFHGVKVNRLMTGFFNRIVSGQNAAHILKDLTPLDPHKEEIEIKQISQQYKHIEPGNFFYYQAQLKDLIGKLNVNRDKNADMNLASFIKSLVTHGRLLYSNTTMFLFEQNNYLGNNHLSNDDYKMSFENSEDEISNKQHQQNKSRLQYLNTEIVQDSTPLLSQAFMNELKSSFFKEYCQFLIQKAGAKSSYQQISYQELKDQKSNQNYFSKSLNPLRPTLGKRNITHNTLNNLANSSTNSIKKFNTNDPNDYTMAPFQSKQKKKKIQRSKKMSEDFSSIDQPLNNDRDDNEYINADKILEEESNSSMIASHQEVASRHNFYKKRNFDRILFPSSNNQDYTDMQNMPRYVFKTRDDAIFVYELTYLNGLIRINVYGVFNSLHILPSQILISHTLLANPIKQGTKKKRELVDEELKLSTKLNTDSFNYDFHTRKIMDMILFPPMVKQQRRDAFTKPQHSQVPSGGADEVNPTVQIGNLVSFYKVPPKYAKNFIDTIILRIDLGYLNKISDLEFMSYFRTKIEQYGLKSYSQKSDTANFQIGNLSNQLNEQGILNVNRNLSLSNQNRISKDQSIKEKVMNLVDQNAINQQTANYDATKYIFYKFLTSQPPLTKLESPFTSLANTNSNNKTDNQDHSDKEGKYNKYGQKSNTNSQIGTGQNSSKNQSKSNAQKSTSKQNQPFELYKKLYMVEMLSDDAKAALSSQMTLNQNTGNASSLGMMPNQSDSNFMNNQSSRNLRATTTGNLLSGLKGDNNYSQTHTQANLNLGAVSNSSNQPQVSGDGKWNSQSKKIWVMRTEKQEHSVSQINMESYDEEENQSVSAQASKNNQAQMNMAGVKKQKKDERTIIDLAFYYICVEDVNNQASVIGGIENKTIEPVIKKNTERYPIRALSIDMYSFINQLETAFNQCRKDLIKDQLWIKFFDKTKNLQLTDIQIGDMLRFSFSYNLANFDERYKEVLRLKSYNTNFCQFLKSMLPNQFYKYEKHTNYSGSNRKENLLLFDPNYQNFLILLDFNFEEKEVQPYLVRKELLKIERPANFFSQDMNNHPSKPQKYGVEIAPLSSDEKALVRKVMNLFVFWHYKQSI